MFGVKRSAGYALHIVAHCGYDPETPGSRLRVRIDDENAVVRPCQLVPGNGPRRTKEAERNEQNELGRTDGCGSFMML